MSNVYIMTSNSRTRNFTFSEDEGIYPSSKLHLQSYELKCFIMSVIRQKGESRNKEMFTRKQRIQNLAKNYFF